MAAIKSDHEQICAISEEAINEHFQALFDQRPEVAEIYYTNQEGRGMLEAKLLPPKIKLQMGTGNTPELFFTFSIDRGRITSRSDNTHSIDQWVLTYRASIAEATVSPDADDDQEEQEDAAMAWKQMKKSFPEKLRGLEEGGYSAQRLFAAISDSQWSAPVEKMSYVPNPNPDSGNSKKMIDFTEWAAMAGPQARKVLYEVYNLIREWGQYHKTSALFTLGVRVRLSDGTDEVKIPGNYEQLAAWGRKN